MKITYDETSISISQLHPAQRQKLSKLIDDYIQSEFELKVHLASIKNVLHELILQAKPYVNNTDDLEKLHYMDMAIDNEVDIKEIIASVLQSVKRKPIEDNSPLSSAEIDALMRAINPTDKATESNSFAGNDISQVEIEALLQGKPSAKRSEEKYDLPLKGVDVFNSPNYDGISQVVIDALLRDN